MPKIPSVSPQKFLKHLKKFGCNIVSINGSHYKIINLKNNRISILPMHSKDLKKGTFAGILNQLKIDAQEFIDSLSK